MLMAVDVLHASTYLRYITNRITSAAWLGSMAFFCAMRVVSDDDPAAGSNEEGHNVWNRVLALCCRFSVGPCLSYRTDIKLEGWHCRVASLSTYSVKKAIKQGQRRLSQAHKLGLVALFFFLNRHEERWTR